MAHDPSTPRPVIKAASACVWRGDEVLLAQRGKTLAHGYWSLPGGKIEHGETAQEAAARELLEETGISARLTHLVGDFGLKWKDVEYLISCYTGYYAEGEAVARSDVMAIAWVHFERIGEYRLAFNNEEAIARARQLLTR